MSGVIDTWSRRRAAVATETRAEAASKEAEAVAAQQASFDEMSDEDVLKALNLPDPDSLGHGDDFSQFMAKVVPQRIRQRALRRLWRSNAVLANLDDLVDYGQDFTDKACVIPDMQTAYQVGRGMLRHITHRLEEVEVIEPEPESEPEEPAAVAEAEEIAVPEEEPAPTRPRRMIFTKEGTA